MIPRGMAQCIKGEIDAFAAQPEVAEHALDDAGRQLEPIDQIRRGEDAIAGLPAEILDTSRGVDGVAEEDDLRLNGSHLASDQRTAMQSSAEIDGATEFAPIFVRLSSERVKGVETGPDAAGLADPFFELPCCDQFVADIAVDFGSTTVHQMTHRLSEGRPRKSLRQPPAAQSVAP